MSSNSELNKQDRELYKAWMLISAAMQCLDNSMCLLPDQPSSVDMNKADTAVVVAEELEGYMGYLKDSCGLTTEEDPYGDVTLLIKNDKTGITEQL